MQRSLHLKKCLKSGKTPSQYQSFYNAFYGALNNEDTFFADPKPEITLSNAPSQPTSAPIKTGMTDEFDLFESDLKNASNSSNVSAHFFQNTSNSSNMTPQKKYNQTPPKAINSPYKQTQSHHENLNWDTGSLDYEVNQLAQKNLKHAISALNYDDVNTAMDLLNQTINALRPFLKK